MVDLLLKELRVNIIKSQYVEISLHYGLGKITQTIPNIPKLSFVLGAGDYLAISFSLN